MEALIVDARIELVEDEYLTVSLKLEIEGAIYSFGGKQLFLSPVNDSSFFFTHFISCLMRTVAVTSFYQLLGKIVKVEIQENQVVGIAGLNSDYFFYAVTSLENLLSDFEYYNPKEWPVEGMLATFTLKNDPLTRAGLYDTQKRVFFQIDGDQTDNFSWDQISSWEKVL